MRFQHTIDIKFILYMFISLVVFGVFFLPLFADNVSAQDETISIGPPSLVVSDGESDEIFITNNTSTTQEFQIEVEALEVVPGTNTPVVDTDSELEVANFVDVELSNISVQAGETSSFQVESLAPLDNGFLGVELSLITNSDTEDISFAQSWIVLILSPKDRIPAIEDIGLETKIKSNSQVGNFVFTESLDITTNITNTSERAFVRMAGEISVRDANSELVVYRDSLTPNLQESIIPDSTKSIATNANLDLDVWSWESLIPRELIVSTSLDLDYSGDTIENSETIYFWPWQVIVVEFVLIVIAILGVFLLVSRKRK